MADIVSKLKRSEVMAAVRSQGNRATELKLIALLRRHRISGWRRHQRVFGKPDFVFPKLRLAVFVDGCFWHACPLHVRRPRNNTAYWRKKLAANKARARKVTRTLRAAGWRVLRIWEHELARKNEAALVRRLERWLG
jgi:DNA mismatch endonuclease (patch repair protein)